MRRSGCITRWAEGSEYGFVTVLDTEEFLLLAEDWGGSREPGTLVQFDGIVIAGNVRAVNVAPL